MDSASWASATRQKSKSQKKEILIYQAHTFILAGHLFQPACTSNLKAFISDGKSYSALSVFGKV